MTSLNRSNLALVFTLTVVLACFAAPASAGGSFQMRAELHGLAEVPSVSTTGHGEFAAEFDSARGVIHYKMRYDALQGDVLQSHIHFARRGQNGGISAFLCSNLGSTTGTAPACAASPGGVHGTIGARDVVGPEGQGIAPGEFRELLRAIHNGAAYVNVHSTRFPGGEIRGQIRIVPSSDTRSLVDAQ